MNTGKRSTAPIARWAVGLALSLAFAAPTRAAGESSLTQHVDTFTPPAELIQQDLPADAGDVFLPLGNALEDQASPQHPPSVDTAFALRQRELSNSPMAPLPPAMVAGPIGLAVASWLAARANRRGGRV
jgi:hypothetical protein